MSSWSDVEREAPELAARVRRVFDGRRHKTLATLRRDGSPRVSGIEIAFEGGEVRLGMMAGSVKLRDVRRDPRIAVHATSDDPPEDDASSWAGDAKIAGRAVELAETERLRIDIEEVVLTRIGDPADHLLIESWHPGARRQHPAAALSGPRATFTAASQQTSRGF